MPGAGEAGSGRARFITDNFPLLLSRGAQMFLGGQWLCGPFCMPI